MIAYLIIISKIIYTIVYVTIKIYIIKPQGKYNNSY